MDREKPTGGEFYRHFKGTLYQVRLLALDSRTGEEMVVYQAMDPPYSCWVRPLSEFMGPVDREKYPQAGQAFRFEQASPEAEGDAGAAETPKTPKTPETPEDIARRGLLQLLDAPTFHEKRQLFIGLKQYMDSRMLNNIAAALDIVLEEDDLETQYESVLRCLEAFERYEGGRLR